MNAETVAALRELLGRAKAAGWYPLVLGPDYRSWWRNAERHPTVPGGYYVDSIELFGDTLSAEIGGKDWSVPLISVAQIAGVLELAGAIPGRAADRDPLIPVLPPLEFKSEPWGSSVGASC